MKSLVAILFALLGVVLHASGIIMQKKGSEGLDFKAILNPKKLIKTKIDRHLITWVAGLLIAYEISVIPTGIASMDLSPQVVSAISGFGIILLIVLSHFFLGEKLYKSDFFYSAAIIILIFFICFMQPKNNSIEFNNIVLIILTLLPGLLLIPAFNGKLPAKNRALFISAFSGLTSGITIIFINVAVKHSGGDLTVLFSSIYIYMFIIIGFISGFSLQAAYKFGEIVHIMPVQILLSILYPLVCSNLVFLQAVDIRESILILLTGICCWAMERKH